MINNVLVVSGGNVDTEFLNEIVDEYEIVIAVDKGMESTYKINRKPNCIVGDFDSVNADILEYYKKCNVETDEYNPEKDYTDTELGIDTAINFAPNKITIVGGIGSRIDHT